MTYLSVHWKGYPHRRPRIQVASSYSSARGRTVVQVAAEQLVRRPFSPSLERARRKQSRKVQSRARKSRSLKSLAPTVSTRKRATRRVKQNLHLFRWFSSSTEIASFNPHRHHPSAIHLASPFRQTPVIPHHLSVRRTTTIPSIDGAGNSVAREPNCTRSEKNKGRRRYSANVSATSWYSTSNRHPHVIIRSPSLCPFIPQKHCAFRGRDAIQRGRTYDPRIAPTSSLEGYQDLGLRRSKSIVISRTTLGRAALARRPRSKIPLTKWKTLIHMGVNQNGHQPPAQVPANSKLTFRPSTSLSRTTSERRALRKFIKELEHHLQTTRNLPKPASLVTSPSSTTVSAYTITELEPYRSQFQAAGLAVTSDEQRGMTFGGSSNKKRAATPPPIPERPGKSRYWYENEKAKGGSVKKPIMVSPSPSGSPGTTVMGFTPSDERIYDHSKTPSPRRYSSSDHTVVSFTPPHETKNQAVGSNSRQSARKSLPWLRKQESPPDQLPSLIQKSTTHEDDVIEDMIVPGEEAHCFPSMKTCPSQPREEAEGHSQSKRLIQTPILSPKVRQDILKYVDNNVILNEQNKRSFASKRIPGQNQTKSSTVVTENLHQLLTWKRDSAPRNPLPRFLNNRSRLEGAQCKTSYQPSNAETPTVESLSKDSPSRSQWRTINSSDQTDSKTSECGREIKSNLTTSKETESGENMVLNASTRQSLWQGRTGNAVSGPQLLEDILPKPDLLNQHYNRGPKSHVCTARSSIVCQQCFPSAQTSTEASPPQSTLPNNQMKSSLGQKTLLFHAQQPPVADPVKRPFPPKRALCPSTTAKRDKKKKRVIPSGSRTKVSARVSNRPIVLKHYVTSANAASSSTSFDTNSPHAEQVSDKNVFKGLHVATAAACDEDIDKWIEDLTGVGVRQFLAGLSKFDDLGLNALANVARRVAQQRRGELEAWEAFREAKRRDRGKAACDEAMMNEEVEVEACGESAEMYEV